MILDDPGALSWRRFVSRTPCDRFVADSALEEGGFEPSVPLHKIKRIRRRPPLSREADVEGLMGASRHERSHFPHYLEPRKTSEKAPVRSSRKLGSAASRPGAFDDL